MPNWVYNNVTIKGSPDTLKQIKEQLNTPFTRQHTFWDSETKSSVTKDVYTEEPVFSFWNIVKPTDLEAYNTNADSTNMHNPNNWYVWNNVHWGTKWDVAGNVDFSETADSLHYSFDTAWAPPIPPFELLSAQYPDVEIINAWEEEQGFGSTLTFIDGDMEETNEYNWICPECDYRELGDPNDNYDDESGDMICPSCKVNANA